MENKVWIEWIGLYGSGKTTCINNLIESYAKEKINYYNSRVFLTQGKQKKIYSFLTSSPSNLISFLKLFFILVPFLIRSYLKKDLHTQAEFRSLLSCYLARQLAYKSFDHKNIAWEGELHLLPLLGLSTNAMEKAFDLIYASCHERAKAIVVMDVNIDVSFKRILEDENSRKNIRFNEKTKLSYEKLKSLGLAQDHLIANLNKKNVKIFYSDGNIQYLRKFIESIYSEA